MFVVVVCSLLFTNASSLQFNNGRRGTFRNGNGGKGGGGGGGGVRPPSSSNLFMSGGASSGGGVGAASGLGVQSVVLFLSKLLESYSELLKKHPYPTKILSSAFVGGTGDVLIQLFQQRNARKKNSNAAPFDFRRLAVFATVAGLYIAPVIHLWFGFLNELPFKADMSNQAKAGIMMLLDQTFGAVIVNAGFFYAFELAQAIFPPYASNKGPFSFIQAGTRSNLNNMWDTLVANWYCWPVINYVNFLVVPIQFRVLFSNFAAVFWNMFLSSVANRPVKAPAPSTSSSANKGKTKR